MIEKNIHLPETLSLIDFFGAENYTISKISSLFPTVEIISRGHELRLRGTLADVNNVKSFFSELLIRFDRNPEVFIENLDSYLEIDHDDDSIKVNSDDILLHGAKGNIIKVLSENQKKIIQACSKSDLVFAIGPAGTGKTYTAVALAVRALKNKEVKKIVITRPAVEAGENLGFLPGDLKEKIDPYLRPIYDALEDMITKEKLKIYFESNTIEIAPLAYMRGRTLNNAFIILDEAQNTTPMQIKMFLTRMGLKSKVVITGDITQIDLPKHQKSGLKQVISILKEIPEIAFVYLDDKEILRHSLVKKIVRAYEKFEEKD